MVSEKAKSTRRDYLRKLTELNDRRSKYIFSLLQNKSMVLGLPKEVFRKCGKKNCRCSDGHLHGPYHAMSVNKNGKQKIVMIKKADAGVVLKKSKRYRYFQQSLARIRKINKEIDKLLENIKTEYLENYP